MVDISNASQEDIPLVRYYGPPDIAGGFGHRWRHNFERSLLIAPDSIIEAIRPAGERITFQPTGANEWRPSRLVS